VYSVPDLRGATVKRSHARSSASYAVVADGSQTTYGCRGQRIKIDVKHATAAELEGVWGDAVL